MKVLATFSYLYYDRTIEFTKNPIKIGPSDQLLICNVKHIKVHHRPEVHLLRIRYEIITCFLWIALHLSMTVMPFFTDMPKNQASGFFAPSALFPFLCLLLFLKHPTNY